MLHDEYRAEDTLDSEERNNCKNRKRDQRKYGKDPTNNSSDWLETMREAYDRKTVVKRVRDENPLRSDERAECRVTH